ANPLGGGLRRWGVLGGHPESRSGTPRPEDGGALTAASLETRLGPCVSRPPFVDQLRSGLTRRTYARTLSILHARNETNRTRFERGRGQPQGEDLPAGRRQRPGVRCRAQPPPLGL